MKQIFLKLKLLWPLLMFTCIFQLPSSPITYDEFVQATASLSYYLNQKEELIAYTNEEVENLWIRVSEAIFEPHDFSVSQTQQHYFASALSHFGDSQRYYSKGLFEERNRSRQESGESMRQLWYSAIECKDETDFDSIYMHVNMKKKNADFESNNSIPSKIKKRIRHYIIADTHPMKSKLDEIFKTSRVTLNQSTFERAKFHIVSLRPRSFVCVARHPQLSGYLVKVYFDTETRLKRSKPSWQWLALRCEGAKKVREIIEKKNIQHFVVASKWIYPLPAQPAPPLDSEHTRHYCILLTTDMALTCKRENYYAWSHYITKDHLDELFMIISCAKGSSYRPDNIAFSKTGKFAFIDTEYPNGGPDYGSIRPFLNPEMLEYWETIVRRGKP